MGLADSRLGPMRRRILSSTLSLSFCIFSAAFHLEAQDFFCAPESNVFERLLEDRQRYAFGELRTSWARELSGQDLAAEDLSKIQRIQAQVGAIDTGFFQEELASDRFVAGARPAGKQDSHGTGVVNTILDHSSDQVDISALFTWEELYDVESFKAKVDALGSRLPQVMNISFSLGSLDSVHQSFEYLASKGVILIASAGNAGGQELDLNNQRFPGIVVGSISPFGVASDYSQAGAAVDILAPTDYFLNVNFGRGHSGAAMGTSFSAPQVTAAIAEIKSILPEISPSEIEILLKQTAIRTIQSQTGLHGAGMLNVVKMVAVAERLKKSGWPLNRSLISSEGLYDFSSEARSLLLSASSGAEIREKNLRRSFFLDQTEESRLALVDYYRSPGVALESMALFYESLSPNSADQRQFLRQQLANGQMDSKHHQAFARALYEIENSHSIQKPRLAIFSPDSRSNALFEARASIQNMEDVRAAMDLLEKFPHDASSFEQIVSRLAVEGLRDFGRKNPEGLAQILATRTPWNYQNKDLRILALQLSSKVEPTFTSYPAVENLNGSELTAWLRWAHSQETSTALEFIEKLRRSPHRFEGHYTADQILVEAGLPTMPKEFGALYFDEPRALQSFVRSWYFASNSLVREETEVLLNELLQLWNLSAPAERRQRLEERLLIIAEDSELFRNVALEALQKLRES